MTLLNSIGFHICVYFVAFSNKLEVYLSCCQHTMKYPVPVQKELFFFTTTVDVEMKYGIRDASLD